jgi:eukaryotic-like serine/threonine-protein kinase
MSGLSDAAVRRLRIVGSWPEFESGRYAALQEIGRGGMGTVYLARDEELGREVAIKIPNAFDRPGMDRRLRTEARALASLEHPGIVPIHDAGRLADGRLFYVMKRVEGRTLRELLESLPDLSERLRVFERLCDPVAFAHARGIIHRDLKPENVMVGAFGEVMVMDWGVAKTVGRPETWADSVERRSEPADRRDCRAPEPTHHTTAGTVIGTRGFMAPEQARGESIDHRADVYALGAILFLLLTNGAPPAEGDQETMLRRHGVAGPLRAICVKALAADAGHRYQSVAALAEDVGRYRAGQAVAAHRETIVERIDRLARTYRAAILLVLGYIIMRAVVAFWAEW